MDADCYLMKKVSQTVTIFHKQYLVHRKFPGRQALNVHIVFQFAVKLFAGGVAMVKSKAVCHAAAP